MTLSIRFSVDSPPENVILKKDLFAFVAQIRDITERKRIEERFRQSGERFRQLAESLTEVFRMTKAANAADRGRREDQGNRPPPSSEH
jgi:PAS domain-containing protein